MREKEKRHLLVMAVRLACRILAAVVMLLGIWCGWVRAWFGVGWIVGFAMLAAVSADRLWRRWGRCVSA